jgi:hypothetical protein
VPKQLSLLLDVEYVEADAMVSAFGALRVADISVEGDDPDWASQPDDPDIGQQWAMYHLNLFR